MKRPRRHSVAGEGGSILLEYILVTFLTALPVVVLWNGGKFDFGFKDGPVELGIYDAGTGEYIGQGKEIQRFFQMVQDGIGLPLP